MAVSLLGPWSPRLDPSASQHLRHRPLQVLQAMPVRLLGTQVTSMSLSAHRRGRELHCLHFNPFEIVIFGRFPGPINLVKYPMALMTQACTVLDVEPALRESCPRFDVMCLHFLFLCPHLRHMDLACSITFALHAIESFQSLCLCPDAVSPPWKFQ